MKALIFAFTAAAALLASAAFAQEPAHWTSLEDGLKAAKKSGKPVLVVTCWTSGVCNTCDTWHDRVPKDADVQKQLPRFEQVEWNYDGRGGSVVTWTTKHGGTSDDPAIQAFVVTADGVEVTRAPTQQVYAPGDFAKWLKEQADAFEKTHPTTRVAFTAADVKAEGEGAAKKWSCPAIDAAKRDGRPVLVYVSRGERADADKAAKAQAAASRKLEKGVLDSEQASKAADGWTLVKLDLTDADHLAFAKTLGVEKAPALVVLVPGEDKPQTVDLAITGEALAFKLKKLATRK